MCKYMEREREKWGENIGRGCFEALTEERGDYMGVIWTAYDGGWKNEEFAKIKISRTNKQKLTANNSFKNSVTYCNFF